MQVPKPRRKPTGFHAAAFECGFGQGCIAESMTASRRPMAFLSYAVVSPNTKRPYARLWI